MTTETKQGLEYRKEALRLAELRLGEQNLTYDTQTNKVVLIGTVCFVFSGYLLAFPIESVKPFEILCWAFPSWCVLLVLSILPALVFSVPFYHCVNALDLKTFSLRGASPNYTMSDYFKCDSYELTERLLEAYETRIQNNANELDANSDKIGNAINSLIFGILYAVIAVVVRKLILVP